jgi:hypothetical protein
MNRCNVTGINSDAPPQPEGVFTPTPATPSDSTVFEDSPAKSITQSSVLPGPALGKDSVASKVVEANQTISTELEMVFIIFEQPIATRLLYQLSGS